MAERSALTIGEYTIEHILPQNENLLPEWRDALGENWSVDRDRLLHTLGNLTLTGYNPEYSDRPFREKRDMEGGFRESPLRVNEGLGRSRYLGWGSDRASCRPLGPQSRRRLGGSIVDPGGAEILQR